MINSKVHNHRKVLYAGGITAQDVVSQDMAAEECPECKDGSEAAGHKLVAPETVAPRTEEELQRHIELSPGTPLPTKATKTAIALHVRIEIPSQNGIN